jgi:hypothetical protein
MADQRSNSGQTPGQRFSRSWRGLPDRKMRSRLGVFHMSSSIQTKMDITHLPRRHASYHANYTYYCVCFAIIFAQIAQYVYLFALNLYLSVK